MRTVALCTAIVCGFLFVCTSVSWADQVINITDLTEGMPTATVDGIPVTPMSDSTDDYLHFQYQPNWTWADHIGTYMWSKDLTEQGSTVLSDRLLVTYDYHLLGDILDVQLDSRDTISIPQGNNSGAIFRTREETGDLQLMFGLIPPAGSNQMFYVASDIDVPEPSTLVLLSIGIISLMAYGWRRRAK